MKRDWRLQLRIMSRIEAGDRWEKFEESGKYPDGSEGINHPSWDDDEVYNLELLIYDGYVRRDIIRDAPWLGGFPDEPTAESYVALTSRGHDALENSKPLRQIFVNIKENVPSIVFSVVAAVLSSWALSLLGP